MNSMGALLERRADGLYCPAGDFHIDPWQPVERALITHAHPDRARPGSRSYLTAREGAPLLRALVGSEPDIQTAGYGERSAIGETIVSFHPAGHIPGSAQVRIERSGEVWVVAGDYKLSADPTCAAFEPVRCHVFVTEATFALPIFQWPAEHDVMAAIHAWWRSNIEAGKTSLLFANPLGKAQRVLAALDASIGPIQCHATIERFNKLVSEAGRPSGLAGESSCPTGSSRSPLIVAPLSAHNTPWARRFSPASTALVSGWMRIRGARRRRSLDRGFILSDHADWPALLRAIDETGAGTVWVTHGYRGAMVRWLEEHGRHSVAIDTPFEGERDDPAGEPAP